MRRGVGGGGAGRQPRPQQPMTSAQRLGDVGRWRKVPLMAPRPGGRNAHMTARPMPEQTPSCLPAQKSGSRISFSCRTRMKVNHWMRIYKKIKFFFFFSRLLKNRFTARAALCASHFSVSVCAGHSSCALVCSLLVAAGWQPPIGGTTPASGPQLRLQPVGEPIRFRRSGRQLLFSTLCLTFIGISVP